MTSYSSGKGGKRTSDMNTMQGYLPAAMILEELKSLITERKL